MGIRELQQYIREHEGFIFSEATLKTSDLLGASFELCLRYGIRHPVMNTLEQWFDLEYSDNIRRTYELRIDYGDLQEEACYVWHEDVFNFFNDICPPGYYFGNTEGDGALFGFFKLEEASII